MSGRPSTPDAIAALVEAAQARAAAGRGARRHAAARAAPAHGRLHAPDEVHAPTRSAG